MAVLVLVVSSISLITGMQRAVRLSNSDIVALGLLFFLFAAVGLYCRWRRLGFALDCILLAGWLTVANWTLTMQIETLARSHCPLADDLLARLDSAFVNTQTIVHAMHKIPVLFRLVVWSYGAEKWFVIAAVFLPVIAGKKLVAYRYVLSGYISGILTSMIFGVLPAVGPWFFYKTSPSAEQAQAQQLLLELRLTRETHFIFGGGGIVSFPSFHVILAILSATSLWNVKGLRVLSIVLAFLICISTIATGWHYVTDVYGGLVVAALSYALSLLLLRATASPDVLDASQAVGALQ